MSTTYTPNAGLAKPARADRNWDVQLNANSDSLDACAAIGVLSVTPTEVPSACLNVKVAPGQFRKSDGTLVTYAGTTAQAVAPNTTTSLWLTEAGVLASGSAFPTGANIVRLAAVTAGGSTVTSISDQRTPWFSFGAVTTSTGTVTSVGLSLPPDWAVTGAPITTSGVLTATRVNQNANVVLAGPASGPQAPPSYRTLVATDLPVFASSGSAHAAGAVPDPGSTPGSARFLREDATWALPSGGGVVSSVALALPSQFVVGGSPVTSSGTLSAGWISQGSNQVFAGPASGTTGSPTFRALVGADLPVFGPSGPVHAPGAVPDPGSTAGTTRFLREDATWAAPPGGTTGVTSVGLSLPAGLNVSGSPVTTSGTISATWTVQNPNRFHAGPPSGSAATPTWRTIAAADLPVFVASGPSHAPGAVPDPGPTAGTTHFLREDGTWSLPPSGASSSTLNVTTPTGYPYTCTATDVLVLVDTTQARTILLPNGTSAGVGRFYQIKDATGSAFTNNTTVTVAGGGTIDGASSAVIANNFGEAEFVSDGTNWKRKYNRPDLIDGNLTVSRKLLVSGNLNLSTCGFVAQSFTLNPNLTINQVNYNGTGAVTATLPTAVSVGSNLVFIVKDIAGTAGTKNITIRAGGSDLIDGGSQVVINTNFGVARLYCDGVSAWFTW